MMYLIWKWRVKIIGTFIKVEERRVKERGYKAEEDVHNISEKMVIFEDKVKIMEKQGKRHWLPVQVRRGAGETERVKGPKLKRQKFQNE